MTFEAAVMPKGLTFDNDFLKLAFNATGIANLADNAASRWSALAAGFNGSGTMGEKLNGAGSAGNPWTEVIEGTYTAEQLLRLISAVLLGKVSGASGPSVTFRDVEDTKDRIIADIDTSGNRTSVVKDAS